MYVYDVPPMVLARLDYASDDDPIFNTYHSEHQMLRYIFKLANKDLSLVHSMLTDQVQSRPPRTCPGLPWPPMAWKGF